MRESKAAAPMKTPLGRVRGWGAARSGTKHFWHQRVTSVAGIALTIAFIVVVIALLGRNHAAAKQILGSPLVALVMVLFVINTVYHMCLGMQEIIVDYVHDDLLKLAALMANAFYGFVVALACIYAVLKLSFGV
jgi:succinate dehydrogenase / fumarate reductase, membrane anchor subunit